MKKIGLLLVAFVVFSCTGKKSDAALLNGYWEIKNVALPGGEHKDFPVSATVDYFELKGNKGFRKKVMPQVDGTYRASDVSEEVVLTEKEGKTWLNYTTQYSKWQEELVSVTDDELVLKNKQGLEYHYARPEKFTVK